jgi:hypothetical protein
MAEVEARPHADLPGFGVASPLATCRLSASPAGLVLAACARERVWRREVGRGTRFAVLMNVAVDRRTQDSDVMERVLGISADEVNVEAHRDVYDLAVEVRSVTMARPLRLVRRDTTNRLAG